MYPRAGNENVPNIHIPCILEKLWNQHSYHTANEFHAASAYNGNPPIMYPYGIFWPTSEKFQRHFPTPDILWFHLSEMSIKRLIPCSRQISSQAVQFSRKSSGWYFLSAHWVRLPISPGYKLYTCIALPWKDQVYHLWMTDQGQYGTIRTRGSGGLCCKNFWSTYITYMRTFLKNADGIMVNLNSQKKFPQLPNV